MELTFDAVLATLCVLGLIGFAWWLVGRILRPISKRGTRILVSGRGSGADLEQTIRGFIWLRSLGLLNCPIIIVDVDLTPDGYELALHLAAKWPGVILWPIEHIHERLEQVYT